MNLTDQDIEHVLLRFNENPSREDYFLVNEWYENNVNQHPNQEYMIRIYLFLLGANIRYKYQPLTYEQHSALIREIRDIVEGAPKLLQPQRTAYLDLGNKSGFFRR